MINYLKNLLNYFTPSKNAKEAFFGVDEIIGGTFLTYKKYLENYNKNIVLICSSTYKANKLYSSIANLVNKDDIILFLENEMIRVEYISESKDILANKIYALYKMVNSNHKIFIFTPSSFFRFYPKKEEFLDSIISLKVNESYDFDKLIKKLSELGYYKVPKIDQSLQFASRGDVIDIFTMNYDNPIRIEFFDDTIESIRFFDIATQSSISTIDKIDILPATTLIFNDEEKINIEKKMNFRKEEDLKRIRSDLKDIFNAQINEDIENLINNNYQPTLYKYYGFLKSSHDSILSYLDEYIEIILEENDILESKKQLYLESHELLMDLFDSGKSLTHLEYFNNNLGLCDKGAIEISYISSFDLTHKNMIDVPLSAPIFEAKKGIEYQKIVDLYLNEFNKILFVVKNKEEFSSLVDYLKFLHRDFNILDKIEDKFSGSINIIISDFNIAIEDKNDSFALVTSKLLFNSRHTNLTYSSKFKEGVILGSYQELEQGDYVVHETYGIGQYIGLSQMELQGKKEDYLEIKFAGNDELFVPLYSFNLIRKYAGQEGRIPKLSSLHSDTWKKTKKRIKDKVNDLADKLLVLYKNRALIKGIRFENDDELQAEFEAEFKHELTDDQKKSLKEIKEDMEKEQPMDRLLCGDVGFGKTEIAFCAAFKAILSNKQVLLLAPTTLLAKQHYEVALDRFRKFDVNIKLLTRNQTPKETKLILEDLENGKINFLIGTHKALSNKIKFKDLGLLIIDEEQRFGVEQKEKIKLNTENIDVLTLSATPIPRTLQSSLVGLKSVSTIQTPPKERLPIQLYVIQKDEKVLKEIIERELARGGQVYFVHNNISDIYELANKIQKMIPEIRVGVVHGKMDKNDVNTVMADFYLNDIDLLLATSIIENGIDVRNANLIIVDDADRFGLSQLYQIKGRVGRGDRMAYCYLLIDKNKKLNDEARKRLKALQDFTELGSGFKIAQRDLLIRGAGEILGREQAGFIDDVGIDLYLKLLNEALKEKKDGQIIKENETKTTPTVIENAYIPSSFASDNEKIELYQKISEADTFDKLKNLSKHIKDIFGGEIPPSFNNILKQREIDIYLSFKEFNELKNTQNSINLILSNEFSSINAIGTTIFMKLINYINRLKLTYHNKCIEIIISKKNDYDKLLLEVLKIIHEEALKNEIR